MEMRAHARAVFCGLIGCLAIAAAPGAGAAFAAPPPNDDRATPQDVTVPGSVDGTTVDATEEEGDTDEGSCFDDGASVWYRVKPKKGRVIVQLAANGDLDATVNVFRVQRSKLLAVTCAATDPKGKAALAFPTKKAGQTYLVRVAQQADSVPDTFTLSLDLSQPATPPGPSLPPKGAGGTLDRVINPADAYSILMREGVTYRFNLTSKACTPLQLFPPGTRSFGRRTPVKRLACGGYSVFTPRGGQSGVYSLLAQAPRYTTRRVKYHLAAGPAGVDDTTPGQLIPNYAVVHDALHGRGLDVVDLYRFDVERRSGLRLSVSSKAGFELRLLTDTGHVLESTTGEIRTSVPPGRYYLALRAEQGQTGRYTLTRLSRTITHTILHAEGKNSATVEPGQRVRLGVIVKPGASGPARIVIERFDPLEGWQFSRRYLVETEHGRRAVSWLPPSVGRYRAIATFGGTRGFTPGVSDYVRVHVERPLKPEDRAGHEGGGGG
jgi:hypothetical protein